MSAQSVNTERHLAREITIITAEGESEKYGLSILTLTRDSRGFITSYNINHFEGETAATIWHDQPLILTISADGRLTLT